MTHYEIIKIDKDGVVEFPQEASYEIGVVKGSYFLLEISPEMEEARLEQIALPGKNLVEVELVVKDEPGVLSAISGVFAKHDVNIQFNESEEISSGEAILILVLDCSNMAVSLDKLKERISRRDDVLEISVKTVD